MSEFLVCKEYQFSIGRTASGVPFMSMPGTNVVRLVDYEGSFALTEGELEHFLRDREAAIAFAARCRRGELRDRRISPADDGWEPFG